MSKANISEQDYYKALSVSAKGITVILKRSPKELFVNNYNSEWLRAWNGNLDLQVCLDYFAIITYITDYYSKDESGTVKLLQEAAKSCKGKPLNDQMRCLTQAFLTHRQIGESEAYYRLFPSLRLSESNITCIFVATGFPENRYKFLRKVSDGVADKIINDESDNNDDSDDEKPLPPKRQKTKISIADKDGQFEEAVSIHEKYAKRPDYLEHICLAQFVMYYKLIPRTQIKGLKFENDITTLNDTKKVITFLDENESELPNEIRLAENLGYMRLRSFPAVLRNHNFNQDSNPHEYFYSELLLYKSWRDESELFQSDINKCIELFKELAPEGNKLKIEIIKDKLLPHKNNIQEAREMLCEFDDRAQHIGDVIDSELQKENEDQLNEGYEVDNEQILRDPGDLLNDEHHAEKSIYKRIDISNLDSLYKSARQLVPEQRYAFDTVIKYVKNLRKASSVNSKRPKPPLLIIHGGAGSGKSKLIEDITSWSEYFLRTADDRNPDQPCIVKTAFTGNAARLIQGLTLHTAFRFGFGNQYSSLADSIRDKMRNLLAKLEIVIIDEISMVKADHLYILNQRLQEIKQSQDDFGGVSVLLFGDLMQLRPVLGEWIFNKPKSKDYENVYLSRPLWELFKPIELQQNHRQGSDKTYADLLGRLRFGIQTESDEQSLKERIIENYPKSSVFLYGWKEKVKKQNDYELSLLPDPLLEFQSINIHSNKKNFKPTVDDKDGTAGSSPFVFKLKLKKNARVMLIHNIDTSDRLTNGATGIVYDFVYRNNQVQYILVEFDDMDSGVETRQKFSVLLERYQNKNLTPIGKVSFEYSIGNIRNESSAKAKIIQFPLTLAWAITVHKYQGQTIRKPRTLVADTDSLFAGGQAYVVFGRVQEIDQLYLLNFDPKKIKVNQVAKKEAEKIQKFAINLKTNFWTETNVLHLKIASLNIRSLPKHIDDLKIDHIMLQSDLLCLNEINLVGDTNAPKIPGYTEYFLNSRRNSGVAVYIKNYILSYFKVEEVKKIVRPNFQIMIISIKNKFDIFSIYRSPSSHDVNDFLKELIDDINPSKPTIICGDFNIDYKREHVLSQTLANLEFDQIVDTPTHIQGHILDHFYIRYPNILKKCFLHSPYYSDHDAICVVLKKTI